MTVQVFYKNKINSKSSNVFALFTDENFKIQKIGAYFSKKEVSFIKKIIRNNKISKKTISSFNLNENSSVILIPLKKNLTSPEVEQIGADFYKFIKLNLFTEVTFDTKNIPTNQKRFNILEEFLHGINLKSYEFNFYKSKLIKKKYVILVILTLFIL